MTSKHNTYRQCLIHCPKWTLTRRLDYSIEKTYKLLLGGACSSRSIRSSQIMVSYALFSHLFQTLLFGNGKNQELFLSFYSKYYRCMRSFAFFGWVCRSLELLKVNHVQYPSDCSCSLNLADCMRYLKTSLIC